MYNSVSIAGFFEASSTASDTIDLPNIDGKPIIVMLSNSQRLKESSCLDSLDAFAGYFDYGGIEIGKGIYLDRDHECRQDVNHAPYLYQNLRRPRQHPNHRPALNLYLNIKCKRNSHSHF